MSNWKEIISRSDKEVKITFVCSGNIIRSAYAEFIAKKYFKSKDGKKIRFDSGACFNQNRYMYPLTKKLLLKEGYEEKDLDTFKPRLIENYLGEFNESTIFIAMTRDHVRYLKRKYPDKTFLLKEMILNKIEDVEDPYYVPEKGIEIMNELKELILKLCEMFEKIE